VAVIGRSLAKRTGRGSPDAKELETLIGGRARERAIHPDLQQLGPEAPGMAREGSLALPAWRSAHMRCAHMQWSCFCRLSCAARSLTAVRRQRPSRRQIGYRPSVRAAHH